MKKYIPLISFIVVLLMLLSYGIVLAADAYTHYIIVRVFNNSAVWYNETPILVTLNNTQLAALGWIYPSGLDAKALEGSVERAHMVDSLRLGLYAPFFYDGQVRTYQYRLHNLPQLSSFDVIVGVDGNFTVSDAATLELDSGFFIDLSGYICPANVTGYIIIKDQAFQLFTNSSGCVTASIWDGGLWYHNATATGIANGEHTINATVSKGYLRLSIDGSLESSSWLAGNSTPDNGNIWRFMEHPVAYLEYVRIETYH